MQKALVFLLASGMSGVTVGLFLALVSLGACNRSDPPRPGDPDSGPQWTKCASLTYSVPMKNVWGCSRSGKTASATETDVEYRIVSRQPLTIETRAKGRETTYSLFEGKSPEREVLMTLRTEDVRDLKCSSPSPSDNHREPEAH